MGRQVLGLVHDEDHVGQGTATDVGERGDLNFALFAHVFNGPVLPLVGSKLAFDEVQVVEQGLHVRVHLFLRISGEVAQILVAQRNNGPGQDDLVEAVLLFERAGKCQERLACSGHPANGHEIDVGVLNRMQGKGLLCVAWFDPVGIGFVDPLNVPLRFVEESHGAGRSVLQDVEVVVLPVVTECRDFPTVAVHVHAANDLAVDPFERRSTRVHVSVVLDLARLVVLSGKVQGLGLEPQVDVLGHQDDLGLGLFGLEAQGSVQDLVVVGVLCKHTRRMAFRAVRVHDDAQLPFHAVFHGNPILQGMLLTQPVQNADALARLEVLGLVAHFESVQFLQHGDGDGHLVVLEVGQRAVVKQKHAGVEDKNFGRDVLRDFGRLGGFRGRSGGGRCSAGSKRLGGGFRSWGGGHGKNSWALRKDRPGVVVNVCDQCILLRGQDLNNRTALLHSVDGLCVENPGLGLRIRLPSLQGPPCRPQRRLLPHSPGKRRATPPEGQGRGWSLPFGRPPAHGQAGE